MVDQVPISKFIADFLCVLGDFCLVDRRCLLRINFL